MAAAVGFSCSFHYCGGEYHGLCFTADTEKDCCGTTEDSDGCCEDKVVRAKYKDDHTPSAFKVVVLSKILQIFLPTGSYPHASYRAFAGIRSSGHYYKGPAPPLLRGIPLYLFIRVLRL